MPTPSSVLEIGLETIEVTVELSRNIVTAPLCLDVGSYRAKQQTTLGKNLVLVVLRTKCSMQKSALFRMKVTVTVVVF